MHTSVHISTLSVRRATKRFTPNQKRDFWGKDRAWKKLARWQNSSNARILAPYFVMYAQACEPVRRQAEFV